MSSLLTLGTSALNAANAGLSVTGHNIANVNTTGYARQVAVQSAPAPQFSGAGYFGRGVQVDTVRRIYDSFLGVQAHQATAGAAEASARADQLDHVNAALGTTDSGIAGALNTFYAALASASDHPSDLSARQAALSAALGLAAQFNDVSSRLDDQRRSVESQVRASLGTVNQSLRDIASLNTAIAFGQGTGQPPNDLIDKRDALIRSLSSTLGVSTVAQDDGTVSLFVANGQALVLGGNAASLEMQSDPYDAQRPIVGIRTGANFSALDSSALTGGSLSGLLKFADQDLSQAEDEIGRLSLAVADAFNARHRLGVDAQGNPGADLFSIGAPVTSSSRVNTGTGTLGAVVQDPTALAASGYRVDFDGTQYTVTRLSDKMATTYASLPQTVDGLTLSMTGAPAAGDSFTVNAVRIASGTMSVAITRPTALALALPVATTIPAGNLGSVSVTSLTVPGTVANPNLTQPVTIRFTGPNTFDVTGTGTGNPTGLTYTPGQPISFNGWTLTLEGTPAVNDTVKVGASTAWSGDNGNGLALGDLGKAVLVDGLTLSDALSGLFGKVGVLTDSARASADAQGAVRDQAVAAEQSVSGVNLDEEAAKLLQYQQAYQAAAKVIATAQTVFDALLNLGK
jgi:flagellar hook-associated protein 1 FlgK